MYSVQELRQVALNGPKASEGMEVTTPVIELPSLQPIEQMIETGQSHCAIGDVVIQNGVTTNQVCNAEMLTWSRM